MRYKVWRALQQDECGEHRGDPRREANAGGCSGLERTTSREGTRTFNNWRRNVAREGVVSDATGSEERHDRRCQHGKAEVRTSADLSAMVRWVFSFVDCSGTGINKTVGLSDRVRSNDASKGNLAEGTEKRVLLWQLDAHV